LLEGRDLRTKEKLSARSREEGRRTVSRAPSKLRKKRAFKVSLCYSRDEIKEYEGEVQSTSFFQSRRDRK